MTRAPFVPRIPAAVAPEAATPYVPPRPLIPLHTLRGQWLVNETPPPGISILSVTRRDLQAYLFSCEPDPQVRNEIRDALEAFLDWFVVIGLIEGNPAAELARL